MDNKEQIKNLVNGYKNCLEVLAEQEAKVDSLLYAVLDDVDNIDNELLDKLISHKAELVGLEAKTNFFIELYSKLIDTEKD